MIKQIGLTIFLLFFGTEVWSQEVLVSYQAENRSLTQIFKDLEKMHDVHFAFSTKQLKGKKASIEAVETSLDQFLRRLLRPLQLEHEFVEHKFVSVTTPESVFVRAQVIDQDSKESLPFATLRLKDTYEGAIADAEGNFNVVIDKPLGAVIEFSFLGYEPYELPIEGYESPERIQVTLSPSVKNLQQIIIREYINNGITTDQRASKITINPQEMEILPGLPERDILLSTQILAGVNSNDESAAGMNIRGSSRDNTFIYWNNIPVYQPAHYFGNISAFIPASIGKVDIYKNHIPADYGGSSAGLVLMESKSEIINKPEFESSINLTHIDFYGRAPFMKDQGSIMFSARRSYNDLWASPTFNSISNKLFEGSITQDVQRSIDEEFRFNSKLVFSDLNFQWIYEPSGQDRFTLSALKSKSVLDYNSVDQEEEFESTQNHEVSNFGLNFKWDHRWGAKLQSQLSATFVDYYMDYGLREFREIGAEDDDAESRTNDLGNLEIRLTNDYAINDNQVLKFGYQLNSIDVTTVINEDSFFEEDFDERFDTRGLVQGLFTDYTGKFSTKFQLGAGLRLNSYQSTGDIVLDPQIRLSYDLNRNWLLKSSIGVYSQYLSAVQEAEFTFSNSIEQHWVVADEEEEIPVVVNRQAVIGFLFDKSGWLVDFDLFYKDLDGLLARNFGSIFEGEEGFSLASERIMGIDMTIKRKWKNYRAWLSYSFQDSKAEVPDFALYDFTSGLNIRHQLQLSQSINLGQFEFSLGYTLKSGLPYTNVTGITLIDSPAPGDDPTEFEPYYEFDFQELNGQRLPFYHRVDVSAWYKFPRIKSAKVRGEVGISILNLFNGKNTYNRSFFIDYFSNDEPTLFRLDKRLLGITPNFSLRFKF